MHFFQLKTSFWEKNPQPESECNLKSGFFSRFCFNFLACLPLLCKIVEKAYLNQHLECLAPKHWSKHTTRVISFQFLSSGLYVRLKRTCLITRYRGHTLDGTSSSPSSVMKWCWCKWPSVSCSRGPQQSNNRGFGRIHWNQRTLAGDKWSGAENNKTS